MGFFIAGGGNQGNGGNRIRFGQLFRRTELLPVQGQCFMQVAWGKMGCKGIGQASMSGQLCTEQAGTQQPDGHMGSTAWIGFDPLAGSIIT